MIGRCRWLRSHVPGLRAQYNESQQSGLKSVFH
jgi:hypothetical protein